MAGHARYTVVIDACVFYSMLQSDVLMRLCHPRPFCGQAEAS